MNPRHDPALRLGIGFEGFDESDAIRRIEASGAGVVILFARNIRDARQCRNLIGAIRERIERPLLFCIDQEGGNVVRFTRDVTIFPGNMALGATRSAELAERQGRITARQLRAVGFNLNLAPVLDLARHGENPGIGQRSFGAEPELAASLGGALVHGMQSGGLGATLKHFPGKGNATVDAHLDLPIIAGSEEEHRAVHLLPFKRLTARGGLAAAAVMSSHVIYRAFGEDRPATFSRRIAHGLLRAELGFEGLLTSDDMEMGAMTGHYGFEESIASCARAGHDVIFVCHEFERQVRAAELLRAALEREEIDPAENAAAIERIAAWCQPARGELDPELWESGERLAEEIATRSICLLEDPHERLPLHRGRRTNVLFPRLQALIGAEDEIGSEVTAFLLEQLRKRLDACEITTYDLEPTEEEIARIAAAANEAEQVVLFTYNAAFLPGQERLVRHPSLCAERCVQVHLRNPFDQRLVRGRCAGVATWGYRACQITAALAALLGQAPFPGTSPIEI